MTEVKTGESKQPSRCTDKDACVSGLLSQHCSSSLWEDEVQHWPNKFASRWEELSDFRHQKEAFALLTLINKQISTKSRVAFSVCRVHEIMTDILSLITLQKKWALRSVPIIAEQLQKF